MLVNQDSRIGFLVFDGITPLDLVGPMEVLTRVFANHCIIGPTQNQVTSTNGMVITPEFSISNCGPIDILMIPGGSSQSKLMENEKVIAFI